MLLTVREIATFTTFNWLFNMANVRKDIQTNDEESRGDSYQTQKQIQIPE